MNIIINDHLIHSGLNFDEIITLSYIVEGNLESLDILFSNRMTDLKKIKDDLESKLYIVQLSTKINLRNKTIKLLDLEIDSFQDPNEFYHKFRSLFPTQGQSGSKYNLRSSVQDIKTKYDKYSKKYKWDRDKVLKVTEKYINDCMSNNTYIKKATNFIHLQDEGSLLASLYDEYNEEEIPTVNTNIKMKSFATD